MIPRTFEPDAMQREYCHDTGEPAPFPVGTVVAAWDATGYHQDQIVIAHPTVIETVGCEPCVAYRDVQGYWGLHPVARISDEPVPREYWHAEPQYKLDTAHAVARVLARAKKLGLVE